MLWVALQYGTTWDDVYSECDEDTKCTIDHRLDYIREKGNLCREPVSKHLADGIFELRAKDKRFLFYFSEFHEIIFVHAFVKKKNEVLREHIEKAKKRRSEIQLWGLKANAIANSNKPSRKAGE
jgi:phage-related protein